MAMLPKYFFLLGLILIFCGLSSACMMTPQNNQELKIYQKQVHIGGYVLSPGVPITVEQYHPSREEWLALHYPHNQPTYSQETPYIDKAEIPWYPWVWEWLEWGALKWHHNAETGRDQALLRARVYNSPQYLVTFNHDPGTWGCISQNAPHGLGRVISQCKSPEGPVVKVTGPVCGELKQACCYTQPRCPSDHSCSKIEGGRKVCEDCGNVRQPCCDDHIPGQAPYCKHDSLYCDHSANPKQGTCSHCGYGDELPCDQVK